MGGGIRFGEKRKIGDIMPETGLTKGEKKKGSW